MNNELRLSKDEDLLFYYQETIMHLGYIAFFASNFAFAPLIIFLNTIFEIRIKLQNISHNARRQESSHAKNIGGWQGVLSFIALMAIPINLYTLMLLGSAKKQAPGGEDETVSYVVKALIDMNPDFWNPSNIRLLLFTIEHFFIVFIIVLEAIIPDVPSDVHQTEMSRIKTK